MEPQETPPVEVPTPPPVTPTPPPSVFSSPLLWMLIVIIILMIIGIAFYYFVSSRQHMTPIVVKPSITTVPTTIATPPTTEPTQSAQASPSATTSDLPPLFPGVEWEKEEKKSILFVNQNRETIESNGSYIQSKALTSFPKTLIDYYTVEMGKRSWIQTLESAGETDQTQGYAKGDRYLNFGTKTLPSSNNYVFFVEYN